MCSFITLPCCLSTGCWEEKKFLLWPSESPILCPLSEPIQNLERNESEHAVQILLWYNIIIGLCVQRFHESTAVTTGAYRISTLLNFIIITAAAIQPLHIHARVLHVDCGAKSPAQTRCKAGGIDLVLQCNGRMSNRSTQTCVCGRVLLE